MPKKVCPNGHIYDSSIYGDECPLCPKGANEPLNPPMPNDIGGGTHVSVPVNPVVPNIPKVPTPDVSGETEFKKPLQQPIPGGRTIIRPTQGTATVQGRKLVGFLVTYSRNPLGKVYNIYEGKNIVGRDRSCDICIPEDNQMSGRHMSIVYRNVDNKFRYHDELSSNGSFVNKELSDDGELKNHDIIRLGGTVFIFIAIPKIG